LQILKQQLTTQLAELNIANFTDVAGATDTTNILDTTNPKIKVIAIESPIAAIEVGDITTTLEIAARLNQQGIFAPAIRPPTVPTPRIRLTLMATHTEAQINYLVSCLSQAWRSLNH
jgi:7-keto-8-aminopelargonate synthetase-like enzyme